MAIAAGLIAVACGSPTSTVPADGSPPESAEVSELPGPSQSAAPGQTATGAPDATATPIANDPAVTAARQVIEAADLADDATIDIIGGTLRFTRAGEEAARQTLQSSTDANALWAALWVYASAGTDPEPLLPLLSSENPSVRALAAANLVALGDSAGFEVLRAALLDEGSLLGAHPPRSIQAYALGVFNRYVVDEGRPAEPASEEEVVGAAAEWSTWLSDHASDLEFDATSGTWRAP